MKTNVHENRLGSAVITPSQGVLLEPRKEDYPSFTAYQAARTAFQEGRKIGGHPM